MSDDDVTVYETKHKPAEPETPRKVALRELAKLASSWREWARDYAEDGHAEQAAFKMAVSQELGAAQDWLAKRHAESSIEDEGTSEAQRDALDAARARVAELELLINTPHTGEFVESIRREAAHQIERWGTKHDAGKAPADWFWLVGFLLGKALHFQEKRKHHIVSSAAALLNWYRAETGDSTAMRPGIEPPYAPKDPSVKP